MTRRARKTLRRRLFRAGFVLLAVVVLTPKIELGAMPQLTAVLNAVGLETPKAG